MAFTPVIKATADALKGKTLEARAALRAAVIAGAPQEERLALAQTVGALETKLVMARSGCTDHWRATLTAEQFAKMLELASM